MAPTRTPLWTRPGLILALLLVANVVLLSALVAIGWGLRGSTYEPGRPTAEDVRLGYVRYALLAAVFALDVVFPAFALSRRLRRRPG